MKKWFYKTIFSIIYQWGAQVWKNDFIKIFFLLYIHGVHTQVWKIDFIKIFCHLYINGGTQTQTWKINLVKKNFHLCTNGGTQIWKIIVFVFLLKCPLLVFWRHFLFYTLLCRDIIKLCWNRKKIENIKWHTTLFHFWHAKRKGLFLSLQKFFSTYFRFCEITSKNCLWHIGIWGFKY